MALAPDDGTWRDLESVEVTEAGVVVDGVTYPLVGWADLTELYLAGDGQARYRVWRFESGPWRAERIADGCDAPALPRVFPSTLAAREQGAEVLARLRRLMPVPPEPRR